VELDGSAYGLGAKITSADIDYSAKQIVFTGNNSFSVDLKASTNTAASLVVSIKGFVNPQGNQNSDSFSLVTFDRLDNTLYFIDQISSGLSVDS
jgi:hypothetical protein